MQGLKCACALAVVGGLAEARVQPTNPMTSRVLRAAAACCQ